MNPSLAETIYADFITSSPTTGAATDADSLPTCEVFEDATDTAILSPTVVKRTGKTGNYRIPIACTAGNGFETGKSYNVIASATVGGVAAKAVVQTFQIRTRDTDDVAVAGDAMILTSAYDAAKTAASQANVATALNAYGALKPTVAGNTLDVTVNGNAGIDWANIENNNSYRELLATYIQSCSSVAFVQTVGNPVVTTKDAAIDAIKAKTDQLTFTFANELDSNIQRINNVTITGDGQVGTEFGV